MLWSHMSISTNFHRNKKKRYIFLKYSYWTLWLDFWDFCEYMYGYLEKYPRVDRFKRRRRKKKSSLIPIGFATFEMLFVCYFFVVDIIVWFTRWIDQLRFEMPKYNSLSCFWHLPVYVCCICHVECWINAKIWLYNRMWQSNSYLYRASFVRSLICPLACSFVRSFASSVS